MIELHQGKQDRYAEMSQDLVDRESKEWNDTWFGNKIEIKKTKYKNTCIIKTIV